MIFVKNSMGGREVNMINTLSKINLSKIGWEGGGSTSIWIMSLNILGFFRLPLSTDILLLFLLQFLFLLLLRIFEKVCKRMFFKIFKALSVHGIDSYACHCCRQQRKLVWLSLAQFSHLVLLNSEWQCGCDCCPSRCFVLLSIVER